MRTRLVDERKYHASGWPTLQRRWRELQPSIGGSQREKGRYLKEQISLELRWELEHEIALLQTPRFFQRCAAKNNGLNTALF